METQGETPHMPIRDGEYTCTEGIAIDSARAGMQALCALVLTARPFSTTNRRSSAPLLPVRHSSARTARPRAPDECSKGWERTVREARAPGCYGRLAART
jgi:hypothetical protein